MKPTKLLHSFLLAAGSSLLAISSASAQTNGTWVGNANWWSDPASWVSGITPTGTDGTANFTGVNITGDINKPLGGAGQNRTIGNIIFTDATTSSHNLTLSGNILTLDVTSGQPNIDVTQSNRTLTISSVVAGNDGLQKSGLGTLTLSGNNTFTGNITISAGTLNASLTQGGNNPTSGALGNPSTAGRQVTIASGATLNFNNVDVLGQGGTSNTALTLIANGGTIRNNVNGINTLGPVQLNGGTLTSTANGTNGFKLTGTVTVGGTAVSTISASGIIGSGGVITYDVADAVVGSGSDLNVTAVVGGIFGTGGITKTGVGTMTLSNQNTYTGLTRIDAGTLALSHATNTIADTGAVNVNGGTLALDANSDTVGAVTLTSGSINGTTGTLTGSSYGVQSGSISARLGGTGVALTKTTTGTVTLTGTNSYTGATAVNAGALQVSGTGSINTTSAINVAAGATFAYNSTTALTVVPTLNSTPGSKATFSGSGNLGTLAFTYDSLDDVIAPGNSPGIQAYGTSQTWSALTYAWELNDWADDVGGTDFDLITVAGSLNLSGTSYALDVLSLDAANATGLVGAGGGNTFTETSNSWTILTTTGGITNFDALEWSINTAGFLNPDTGSWSLSVVNGGNDLLLSYTAVPEPGAALLGSLGLLALLRRRRN